MASFQEAILALCVIPRTVTDLAYQLHTRNRGMLEKLCDRLVAVEALVKTYVPRDGMTYHLPTVKICACCNGRGWTRVDEAPARRPPLAVVARMVVAAVVKAELNEKRKAKAKKRAGGG